VRYFRLHGRTARLVCPCWKAQSLAASLDARSAESWDMPETTRKSILPDYLQATAIAGLTQSSIDSR
jgi:hypothetical protein